MKFRQLFARAAKKSRNALERMTSGPNRALLDLDQPFGARQASQNNLLLVQRVCSAASIEPLFIEKDNIISPAIFLREEDRPRFFAALAEAWDGTLGANISLKGSFTSRVRTAEALKQMAQQAVGTVTIWRYYSTRKKGPKFNWVQGTRVYFYRSEGSWLEAVSGERMAPRVHGTADDIKARLELASAKAIDRVSFGIDVVYTWVDGSDKEWQRRKALIEGKPLPTNEDANTRSRFENRDELRYSIRSIFQNAPWVRNIYIVTDRQVPRWYKEHPRCKIIDHRDIFPQESALPTFNSHSIESVLHRIPGLAEHFIYFNDDVFLGRPVSPETFFDPNGILRVFVTQSRIPQGPRVDLRSSAEYASNNTARLIEDLFGLVVRKRPKHAPYAMTKSLMMEIENKFKDDFQRVRSSQFRSPTDISVVTYLFTNYALATRNGVYGPIDYQYINISGSSPRAIEERFALYFSKPHPETFCLNDTVPADTKTAAKQHKLVLQFMADLFPIKSPYEK